MHSQPESQGSSSRTIIMPGLTVNVMRGLFRNLQAFRAYYETEHEDTIRDASGREWCLWDIEYLFEQRHGLSPRQCEAIELCLYLNMTEEDAALHMGVSPTNPVAMYATDGLKKMLDWIESGTLSRFADERVSA